jgi:XRE family transcriptional regulator, regulator of sulfur utilization
MFQWSMAMRVLAPYGRWRPTMDELLTTIGTRLRDTRESLGLSQEAVAARARVNTSYLSQIERGRKAPSLDVFVRLATAVNLTLAELFADQEGSTPSLDVREVERLLDAVPDERRPALLALIRAAADLAAP